MTAAKLLPLLFLPFPATPSPNIILIVADDLGYNDVSWHNPDIVSPNLARWPPLPPHLPAGWLGTVWCWNRRMSSPSARPPGTGPRPPPGRR